MSFDQFRQVMLNKVHPVTEDERLLKVMMEPRVILELSNVTEREIESAWYQDHGVLENYIRPSNTMLWELVFEWNEDSSSRTYSVCHKYFTDEMYLHLFDKGYRSIPLRLMTDVMKVKFIYEKGERITMFPNPSDHLKIAALLSKEPYAAFLKLSSLPKDGSMFFRRTQNHLERLIDQKYHIHERYIDEFPPEFISQYTVSSIDVLSEWADFVISAIKVINKNRQNKDYQQDYIPDGLTANLSKEDLDKVILAVGMIPSRNSLVRSTDELIKMIEVNPSLFDRLTTCQIRQLPLDIVMKQLEINPQRFMYVSDINILPREFVNEYIKRPDVTFSNCSSIEYMDDAIYETLLNKLLALSDEEIVKSDKNYLSVLLKNDSNEWQLCYCSKCYDIDHAIRDDKPSNFVTRKGLPKERTDRIINEVVKQRPILALSIYLNKSQTKEMIDWLADNSHAIEKLKSTHINFINTKVCSKESEMKFAKCGILLDRHEFSEDILIEAIKVNPELIKHKIVTANMLPYLIDKPQILKTANKESLDKLPLGCARDISGYCYLFGDKQFGVMNDLFITQRDNASRDEWLEELKHHTILRQCPFQDEELCIVAVTNSPKQLMFVYNQTKSVCDAAIKVDRTAYFLIRDTKMQQEVKNSMGEKSVYL